jgi:tetratricopeptide (TPR) repeat protein
VEDGAALWADQFDQKFTDLFAVQDDFSKTVAATLSVKLSGEENEQLAKRYTENLDAYQAYLKGQYFWGKFTPEGLKKSIEYFNQAITTDATYALAYSGIAASYSVLGNTGIVAPKEANSKAKWAAEKALELDPALPQAHGVLGAIKLFYEWDWMGAEREIKRSIELRPNASTLYSYYLEAMGRVNEAEAAAKHAQELEPLSPLVKNDVGYALYYERQYDEAIQQASETLEIDPNFLLALILRGRVYEQKGMYEQAIAEFQHSLSISSRDPLAIGSLGHAYAKSAKRAEAQKLLDELKGMSEHRYVSPYAIALIYTGLGEKDQALAWLEKAYEARDGLLIWLKVEPLFDGLRSDPRFADLLRRVGLAQ